MQQWCPLYRDSTVLSDSRVKTILGVIHHWDNFPGGSFPRGHCQRGTYVGVKSSKRKFSSGQILGGYCLGAIIFGVIIREQLSGGNHPGDNYPGRNCPGGAIIQGTIFKVVSSILFQYLFHLALLKKL